MRHLAFLQSVYLRLIAVLPAPKSKSNATLRIELHVFLIRARVLGRKNRF